MWINDDAYQAGGNLQTWKWIENSKDASPTSNAGLNPASQIGVQGFQLPERRL